MNKHVISRTDILPMAEYARVRDERRRGMAAFKRDRRLILRDLRVCLRQEHTLPRSRLIYVRGMGLYGLGHMCL
jgi:hypothetical protein